VGLKIVEARDRGALAGLYAGGWDPPQAVRDAVAAIIADVRTRGDEALLAYSRRFDDPNATLERLRVEVPAEAEAESLVPRPIAEGLRLAHRRVREFHERQRPTDLISTDPDGTINALLYQPLGSVGAYVPGGTAVLPSSVIMTVTPAKLAGVQRIVVATPPRRDGTVDPAILYACRICGVDELYAIGGAQAIAALAYGTATIASVDKIVGPGNVWVTEAKRQVFGRCGIDGLAGPSEVLVVADATAQPKLVAGEMLAQAEHDPLARVATVSTEHALLEAVADLLEGEFVRETGRSEIVESVLSRNAYLIHARSRSEIIEVIRDFAPEHLSLQVSDPWELIPSIRNAGAIFVGPDTPVAAGDYIAGSNHVLPTAGAARYASGLRTADFYRTMSLVENSRTRMHADREILAALAEFEGLPAHARTALMRE
jgi:histidinol dehydrogenase